MRCTSGVVMGLLLWASGASSQAAEPPKVLATGDWSKAVADSRGRAVRGRLVLCEKPCGDRRRETPVYVELQDASDSVGGSLRIYCDFGKTDFRPEYKGGLRCELRDKDRRLVPSTSYPFSGAIPKSEWVTLPSDATLRLRSSPFGIHRHGAMAISPDVSSLWVIAEDAPAEYFLSGTFTVDPAADRVPKGEDHVWRGVLDLPAVRLAQPRKLAPVKSWIGQLDEKRLAEMAPAKGYVTSEAEWKKLWKAWRPGEDMPAVDFTKHLVLVGLGGIYPVAHEARVTGQGDLQVRLSLRMPAKPGHGYGITVIERGGVTTIQGKAIVPD